MQKENTIRITGKIQNQVKRSKFSTYFKIVTDTDLVLNVDYSDVDFSASENEEVTVAGKLINKKVEKDGKSYSFTTLKADFIEKDEGFEKGHHES